jgi:hypothetical protein
MINPSKSKNIGDIIFRHTVRNKWFINKKFRSCKNRPFGAVWIALQIRCGMVSWSLRREGSPVILSFIVLLTSGILLYKFLMPPNALHSVENTGETVKQKPVLDLHPQIQTIVKPIDPVFVPHHIMKKPIKSMANTHE